jgi:hypothetical protein
MDACNIDMTIQAKANEFILKYGNKAVDVAFECRYVSACLADMESTTYWSKVASEVIEVLEGNS